MACTSFAYAQSSVEIYGIVDAGYTSHTIDNGLHTGTSVTKRNVIGGGGQSTSRLGFRGTEDIGGGVKAGFLFEMGLAPTGTADGSNGTGAASANNSSQPLSTFDNRQAFVSLGSEKSGTLSLGRQYTPMFTVMSTYNAGGSNNVVGDVSNTRDALAIAPTNIISGLRADGLTTASLVNRASNTAAYVLPTFASGLTTAVAVVDTRTQNNGTEAGLKGSAALAMYTQGAFSAGAAAMHGTASNVNVAAGTFTASTSNGGTGLVANATLPIANAGVGAVLANDVQLTNSALGASYDLGVAKLFYTRTTLSVDLTAAITDKRTSNKVGAQFPMGQWVHFVQYGKATLDETGAQNEKNKAYQLGTSYNFSKRTNAYAIYGKNKDTIGAWEGSEKQVAMGIRHQF